MLNTAKTKGTYQMQKDVAGFFKAYSGTDTISEGEYQSPEYKVNPSSLEGYQSSWRPTELHVFDRTPDDEARAIGYKRQQMRDENPSDKEKPLSDEEKMQRVNNINMNNREVGLAPQKEMLPPVSNRSVQLGTSIKGAPEANSVANRFIDRG